MEAVQTRLRGAGEVCFFLCYQPTAQTFSPPPPSDRCVRAAARLAPTHREHPFTLLASRISLFGHHEQSWGSYSCLLQSPTASSCEDGSFWVLFLYTYRMLRLGIQFAGCFIQNDDLRVSNQSSDHGDALLLSSCKMAPTFSNIWEDKQHRPGLHWKTCTCFRFFHHNFTVNHYWNIPPDLPDFSYFTSVTKS